MNINNELISEKLKLNTKLINLLWRYNVRYINQMEDTKEFWDELLWFKGMGKKSLAIIKKEYRAYKFWEIAARGSVNFH